MRSMIIACCVLGSASLAQQPEPTPKPKAQNLEFTGQEIEAGPLIPLADIYFGSPKPKFRSLIKLRMNFDDKLAESVHER